MELNASEPDSIPAADMPNLARNLAHEQSNELIREWLAMMPEQQGTRYVVACLHRPSPV